MSLPVHRGPFGEDEAHRLLWRAGFGPRPGQAAKLAELGLDRAVRSLTHPVSRKLAGPRPHAGDRTPLAPRDAWGHDHLWWLDRMVRTKAPLVERMTLVWHDWFATSKSGGPTQTLMLRQNATLRRLAFDRFDVLAREMTRDPAMLLWLNGTDNTRENPNENYARELQELFCLGAGRGYSERDVRELARALTGFRNDWSDAGPVRFRFDAAEHDTGAKTLYGRRARYGWQDAVQRVVEHRKHPSHLVARLWAAFVPTPPPPATARGLERLYLRSRREIRPLVEAILRHPHLYDRDRRMVKPPVVQAAGMLRAVERGIDGEQWTWLCASAGQELFAPPNVAGWDATRWLDTATFRARWNMAAAICQPAALESNHGVPAEPAALVRRATSFWADPPLSSATRHGLERYAADVLGRANSWQREEFPRLTLNALRMLVATSPDFLTS